MKIKSTRPNRKPQNYTVAVLTNTISITFDNKRYGIVSFLLDNNDFNLDFLKGRPHLLLQAVKPDTRRTFFYITHKPDKQINRYKYLHKIISDACLIDPITYTSRVKFLDHNSRNMTINNMEITEIHHHRRKKPVHSGEKQVIKRKIKG